MPTRHRMKAPRMGEMHAHRLPIVTIHIGDLHVSKDPVRVKTVLGSCIAACLFDPVSHIGGMNHFLLPGSTDDPGLSTRYGVNAMEKLINEMMKQGAHRLSIEAKIFGGADMFQTGNRLLMVGAMNISFINEFLATESIPVISSRVGGNHGLLVIYHPHTFEVFVKPLTRSKCTSTKHREKVYRGNLTKELNRVDPGRVMLFE
ncbi:MAG TPA: chemotaxis protein CheD [Bacteroidota bacterium]|nr:chemotaxis protein CheD [Bacteroidota bacterium]